MQHGVNGFGSRRVEVGLKFRRVAKELRLRVGGHQARQRRRLFRFLRHERLQ
jgi:hypothetical protein